MEFVELSCIKMAERLLFLGTEEILKIEYTSTVR